MRIDGRIVSQQILSALTSEISERARARMIPTLGVILVGSDPGSLSYIRQKQRAAETIGARIELVTLPADAPTAKVRTAIETFNTARTIHGIILQRPLPGHLRSENVGTVIRPEKDVDGFLPHSPFSPPVSLAVLLLLHLTRAGESGMSDDGNLWDFTTVIRVTHDTEFPRWLRSKSIVIIGRGETSGAPIAASLAKLQCATLTVHSKTPDPDVFTRGADIIISCVGKKGTVRSDTIKPGAILIGVGLWRDTEGKLHGDYEEKDIDRIASFYTPTPGGVGPVNVACLMGNLVLSAQRSR